MNSAVSTKNAFKNKFFVKVDNLHFRFFAVTTQVINYLQYNRREFILPFIISIVLNIKANGYNWQSLLVPQKLTHKIYYLKSD